MRGIRKGANEPADVWYGGRTPVGNIKFREPIYREESDIFVSCYSVGITVFMAIGRHNQPVELTFKRHQALDLVSCLSDALETTPGRGKQWRLIGTVDYSISDWDDPTLNHTKGSVVIESRRKTMGRIIRIHPLIGQYDGEPDEGEFELNANTVRKFMNLMNKAISLQKIGRTGLEVEREEEAGISPKLPRIGEDWAKDEKGKRGDKFFKSTLEFFEITYKRKSAFYVASYPELTSIFVIVGIDGPGMGGDCDIIFDGQKLANLIDVLNESLQTARGGPEDWKRIGSAAYTHCDWDDWQLEDLRGCVTVDARVGRIRLTIRTDPRSERGGDWSIVMELSFIEELIVLLEELKLRNESKTG
jgi:hypothetical protein